MKLVISVIICTHNPRHEYLRRVLDSLKNQTLDKEVWELLIIDNASNLSLASKVDLAWHCNSRHISEKQLGLTHARICGIQQAKANILIFVDDDNILSFDYLEKVKNIANDWPMLGAWGGQCLPDFEIEPPTWTKEFWEYLGIRFIDRNRWSNFPQWESTPIGAGLCVRKNVAEVYAHSLQNDPRRINLDRQGNTLLSCGDMDFAYTACDMGLGIGIFTDLKLLHLMPPDRLEESYLLRMVEQAVYSRVMLYFLRGNEKKQFSWKEKLKLLLPFDIYPKNWSLSPRERRFKQASDRGYTQAMKTILQEQ